MPGGIQSAFAASKRAALSVVVGESHPRIMQRKSEGLPDFNA
jgi:hypothetical protein